MNGSPDQVNWQIHVDRVVLEVPPGCSPQQWAAALERRLALEWAQRRTDPPPRSTLGADDRRDDPAVTPEAAAPAIVAALADRGWRR